MKKVLWLLVICLAVGVACSKAGPKLSDFIGIWNNADTYIEVKSDGEVVECYGTGADLSGSSGQKVKGATVINPESGEVIYKIERKGDNLLVDGKEYVKSEYSKECKDFMSY